MADLVDRRLGLLFAGFLTLLAVAALQTVRLTALNGSKLASDAAAQQVVVSTVLAPRGTISDRNGEPLAISEAADDVSADPYLIHDPVVVAAKLGPLLGLDRPAMITALTKPHSGFVYLARQLPAATASKIARLHLAGITLTQSQRRVYPRGWMASQVLGSVGLDGHGLSGLEYYDNTLLRGRNGVQRAVDDALGKPISLTDPRAAVPGADIELNLDSQIQDKAEAVLQQVGATYRPKAATAIVMNPRNGDIYAIANWPRINANDPSAAPASAQMDLATGMDYEPGSTFKAFTIAGALTDKLVTPSTEFNLGPTIQVADRTIGEAEGASVGYRTLTTGQILKYSSNVGAITIGLKLGADRFNSWIRRFGFGKPTGVDLPGEERGLVLEPSQYSGSSMGNLPIGQGESVTPMQIATAYSAIANGGILRSPRIVRRVNGRLVREPKGHRVISAHVAAQLREMLEGVLAPGGTASEVSIPGYKLAGKTGTAQKFDPATGQYSNSAYVASFVGMAPAQHPQLLITVVVDTPQTGSIYGGQVAAPAFGQIASMALQYLRIPPS